MGGWAVGPPWNCTTSPAVPVAAPQHGGTTAGVLCERDYGAIDGPYGVFFSGTTIRDEKGRVGYG